MAQPPPPRPRLGSRNAARSLFRAAEGQPPPAEPALLQLKRVVGFSGDRHGLLLWLQEAGTILYAVAALLILQVRIRCPACLEGRVQC